MCSFYCKIIMCPLNLTVWLAHSSVTYWRGSAVVLVLRALMQFHVDEHWVIYNSPRLP